MSASTTSSAFPDINVWLALSSSAHRHHALAGKWYSALPRHIGMAFCRHTQLGLLRLLTTAEAMEGQPLTQKQAWKEFDRWIASGVVFADEPPGIEASFRLAANRLQASPKDWADSYLIAFSLAAGLQLVTFDQALAQRTADVVLLKPD